jgi:SnoaL-like domain
VTHPAAGSSDGLSSEAVVDAFFVYLSARDWGRLRRILSNGMERVGPFGDRIVGRDGYLDFLRGTVPPDYGNDVRRIVVGPEGRTAFARVTEHLKYGQRQLHLEEAYSFDLGDDGLISRVEVYWQTPELDASGFASANQ